MRSFSWIKDSLIQIVFISFAVVLTVFIAQISLGEQYTEYYDGKLASKSEVLARNAASLFTENGDNQASHTIDSMSFILNVIFPSDSETDNIRYALFEADGKTIAANTDIDVALPDEALQNVYTCTESEYVRSFYPLDNKDFHGYTLMVQIDDTPFLEYGEELQQSLYSSLFRGCLMMSGGYLLFSAISNLKKKKKPTDNTDENDENGEEGHDTLPVEKMSPERRKESTARLIMQFVSMFGCTALALLTFWLYKNEILPLFIFVLFTSIAGLHFLRIVIWFLAWFSKRPITGYAAQTMQFFVFLVVFLSMYIYSISGGYTTQIESVKQDELRLSSVFAGLALSGNERIDKTLLERAQHMDFGEDNELFLVTRTGDDFSVYTADDNPHDVSEAADLFESAWGEQSSVTGVRGGYKYGVTVIADNDYNVSALAVIRQLDSILADEMQSKSLDFMLAMSATVFAFVFLFVEVNRLLETVNIPNVKRERKYKYAKSITSLMFFANVCKQYPAFFLILIVFNIYENNPISWLPRNLAIMLPIMTMV
ncbi:MAG: hypothetical protein FWG45_06545, partial [Oscillospiraceae bacterium]|nr:hypothetical protein [Oscillospiraceae bacterium]